MRTQRSLHISEGTRIRRANGRVGLNRLVAPGRTVNRLSKP